MLFRSAIRREHSALTKRAKALKRDIDQMQPLMVEQWMRRQWTTGPKIAGIGTPYLFREGWAKVARDGEEPTDAEKARAIAALDAAGMGDLAGRTINHQTLSARFREWERNGEDPPAELEGAFVFEKRSEIRVRGAGS